MKTQNGDKVFDSIEIINDQNLLDDCKIFVNEIMLTDSEALNGVKLLSDKSTWEHLKMKNLFTTKMFGAKRKTGYLYYSTDADFKCSKGQNKSPRFPPSRYLPP